MTTPDPQYHVGDRVTFTDVTTERTGIVRSFQYQDWSDEPLAIIDIDPPLRGAVGRSMSRRVEQRHITGRAR